MMESTVQAAVQTAVTRNQAMARTPHLLHLMIHMSKVIPMSIRTRTMPVRRSSRLRGNSTPCWTEVVSVQLVCGIGSSGLFVKLKTPGKRRHH